MFHFLKIFKQNKELKQFYLSIFLRRIGMSLIGIFTPIYFYQIGYSIVEILFFYFLVSFIYLFFSYTAAKIISKIGEKHAILLATFFDILFFIGLIFLEDLSLLFYILPFIAVPAMSFYWMSYHLLFTQESHKNERSQELSMIGILIILAGVITPYLGGLIAQENFNFLFIISAFFMLISTIPLFLSKDKRPQLSFNPSKVIKDFFNTENRGTIISFTAFGVEHIIDLVIWPIFIITIVGNLEKTGLIVSITTLLSLLVYKLIGKYSDRTNKISLLKKGNAFYTFSLFLRLFAVTTPLILFIDSMKNMAGKILEVPLSAHKTELSKRIDYFEFIFVQENFYKLSRVTIIPLLMFIFWIGYYPFTITVIIAALFSLGYKYIHK